MSTVDSETETEGGDGPDEAPARRWRVFGLPVSVVGAGVLGVVMLLLIVLLATREPASDRQADSPLLGRAAPRIEGTTIQGRDFDSDTYDGRWLVVNFFATWCVPCVQEHPELAGFQRAQRDAGQANLISVVFSDDQALVEAFFDRHGGDWPVVLADPETISEWGVAGVPESFVVDPSGTVRYKLIGGVTAQGLSELVSP
ncbi:MAG TPA: TlpA disulfide reductase family protein [Iamia sp.]|nr:TlpA disulfide reductase family protein [Iamia sp.]